jgi:diadenosine tetraphosphatase ApaH/serine/threonine PP2A family protein phosphatase
MRANFARMERDVCFVGHSHVPAIYYQDGRLFRPRGSEGPYALGTAPGARAIVNVGSVGQPRDGDPRLSYVMYDGETVSFVRLEYDHAAAAAAIRAVEALPDFLAERLFAGR